MKLIHAVCCLALLGAVGCGRGSSAGGQTNAASGNPITAPVDYLAAVNKGKQTAIKTIDIVQINQAVSLFQVSEERLPKDLDELVSTGYLGEIPEPPYKHKIIYNPTNGQVNVVPVQ